MKLLFIFILFYKISKKKKNTSRATTTDKGVKTPNPNAQRLAGKFGGGKDNWKVTIVVGLISPVPI